MKRLFILISAASMLSISLQAQHNSTTYTTTTTTTVTTSTTTGGPGSNHHHYNHNQHPHQNPNPAPAPCNNPYVMPGYNGVYGCPAPMSPADFESAKQSIKEQGFDETRLTLAKQIIGSNCLLCSQIKELMGLLSFEATRLDLAEYAWQHNLDKGNYYKLNDAFSFSSSVEELNQYIQGH